MILDSSTPAGRYPSKVVKVDEDREMIVSHVDGHGFIITAKNGGERTRMALSPEATEALAIALLQALSQWTSDGFKVWTHE